LTGWQTLDPIIAIIVGLNIIWTAYWPSVGLWRD
jgi:divalent metal cation (Fe/Co/Zn/Cd) transporter